MLKVKSITDVITNSSSETFLVLRGNHVTRESLQAKLNEVWKTLDDCTCSGMGGVLDVFDFEEWGEHDKWGISYPFLVNHPELFVVELDQAMRKTIEWLISNHYVLDTMDSYPARNEKGRVTGVWGGSKEDLKAWDYVEEFDRFKEMVESSKDPNKANEAISKWADEYGMTQKEAQIDWWNEVFNAEKFLEKYKDFSLQYDED